MDDEYFKKLIDLAYSKIPDEFKEKIKNVEIVIQDMPNDEQMRYFIKRGSRKVLLGLYQGIPQTRRVNYGIGGPLPDKITLFKIPLLRISRSYQELAKNIQNTLEHEIAHHFGIDEPTLAKLKESKIN